MLTEVVCGETALRGISVGGVYTSIGAPTYGVLFDVGVPLRSLAGLDTWLISHAHVDHIGSLVAQLGIRWLHGKTTPPRVLLPAEAVADVTAMLAAAARSQRGHVAIEAVAMQANDEVHLRGDLWVKAVQTFHPVPSLGYLLFRKVMKLRAEFAALPGAEIAALRKAGHAIADESRRYELAYVTDSLPSVFDHAPEILDCNVVISECTFWDDRKSRAAAKAGCHIHLDDLLERAPQLAAAPMAHLVLMHVSQLYRTDELAALVAARVPAGLREKIRIFANPAAPWFG